MIYIIGGIFLNWKAFNLGLFRICKAWMVASGQMQKSLIFIGSFVFYLFLHRVKDILHIVIFLDLFQQFFHLFSLFFR